MPAFDLRRKKIVDHLRLAGEADVAELVALTNSSEATIRRDLLELEAAGQLMRTFGGARSLSEPSLVDRAFDRRSQLMSREKEQIALAAAKLVKPGMTLMIDSGTTCRAFASRLVELAPLQIITSALAVVEALGEVPGIEIFAGGGKFRFSNLDFVDPLVDFSQFHADLLILGCDSIIPGKGFFSFDMQSAAISRQMAGCADQVVVLADHSKIGAQACHRILDATEVDILYTTPVPEKIAARLRQERYRTVFCSKISGD